MLEFFRMLFLGLFCLIYGIAHVTNLKIVWMDPICGIAALIAGALCLFSCFASGGFKRP